MTILIPPTPTGPINSTYGSPCGQFWAINNPWGRNADVMGVNFSSLIEIDPVNFPGNTVQTWAWPPSVNGYSVRSFDEIMFGMGMWNTLQPKGIANPPSKQITQFISLKSAYCATISGEISKFNVAWECFPTRIINGQYADEVCEVMLFPHMPWIITQAFQFTAHGYDFYLGDNGHVPMFIIVPTGAVHGQPVPAKSTNLAGIYDWLQIFNDIIAHGASLIGTPVGSYSGSGPVLTGNEYVNGLEWGVEVREGKGCLITHSLTVDWR